MTTVIGGTLAGVGGAVTVVPPPDPLVYAQATGGAVTDVDGFRYHTFTDLYRKFHTLTVTRAGVADVLCVGGGGAGGGEQDGHGGGGGGGQVVAATISLPAGAIEVINGGGTGNYALGLSSLGELLVAGGGENGWDVYDNAGALTGLLGGGGGGGVRTAPRGGYTTGLSVPSSREFGWQHMGGDAYFAPGDGTPAGASAISAAAGGAGDTGPGSGGAGASAGAGGSGTEWFATGTRYGGGGGGGCNGSPGLGGLGGGGNGGNGTDSGGASGADGTGGGGGGSGRRTPGSTSRIQGGTGGTGVVIVRYPI